MAASICFPKNLTLSSESFFSFSSNLDRSAPAYSMTTSSSRSVSKHSFMAMTFSCLILVSSSV